MPLESRTLYRTELDGDATLVWLLEVHFAGRDFFWATESIAITDAAGRVRPFEPGLDIDGLPDEIDLWGEEDERSVSIEVVFPVDVAELIEQGHDLADATAEVSRIVRGTEYEDREIYVVGAVVGASYGDSFDPVTFEVVEEPALDRGTWPPIGAAANPTTYSTILTEDDGLVYPFVFGNPGDFVLPDGSAGSCGASPALVVDFTSGAANKNAADTVLIAGHRIQASLVTVHYQDSGASGADPTLAWNTFTGTVAHTTDGLGRTVATLDVTGNSTTERKGWPFFIEYGGSGGGGVANPYKANDDLDGAGDIIRYMLERSTLAVDYGSWEAVRQFLNTYRLAGFIDVPVHPWQWLVENVFPLLPLTVRTGPRGRYPIVWRWNARPQDAVASITAGPGIERVSNVQEYQDRSDLATELRIRWALDLREDSFLRESSFLADPDTSDPEQHGSFVAKAAVARHGEGRVDIIETDTVYDFSTVCQIASWSLIARGFPHRTVTYSVPQEYGWLVPGDVVRVTDSDLSISSRVALVQSVERSDAARIDLGLLLVDNPLRDVPSA